MKNIAMRGSRIQVILAQFPFDGFVGHSPHSSTTFVFVFTWLKASSERPPTRIGLAFLDILPYTTATIP
jgi:hypothetical protein